VRPLIHGWMLVCLLLLSSMFTSACTTPHSTARPTPHCRRWDVDGQWSTNQSNGFVITFVVRQAQEELTGTADSGSGPVPLIGTMRDNQLAMTVSWSSGGAGRYTATMNPDGLLTDGFTQNLSMPASTASWSTAEQFKCEVRSR
jgi:hypothetical protein